MPSSPWEVQSRLPASLSLGRAMKRQSSLATGWSEPTLRKRDPFSPAARLSQGISTGPPNCDGLTRRETLRFFGVLISGSIRCAKHALDLNSRRKEDGTTDRKSTRLNSSHLVISYAVFCL